MVLGLEILVCVALWFGFIAMAVPGASPVAYDTFRDMAYARGILAGHLGEDPMVAGLPAWYPPGMPALFAVASALTGLDVFDLYVSSPFWFGWSLPVALFLLVRGVWGRTAAWLAMPFVVLGSRWWLVHALMPMSSIESVSLAILTLSVWHRFGRTSWRGAVAAAVLLAATLWSHTVCGAIVVGAILGHEALAWRDSKHAPDAPARWKRPGLAGLGLGALLGAPPVVAQLVMPRVNEAPHHWFGPELHDPRFALHADTPLAPILGIVGLVTAVRRHGEEGWLVAYVLLAAVGLALGYAGHDLDWPVPWVLPHQFQWHLQLGLMIAAAVGATRIGERLAHGLPARALAIGLALVSLAPVFGRLRDASSHLIELDRRAPIFRMSDWIQRNLPRGSILVSPPDPAYIVAALSGSRAILLPAGHLNPAADAEQRARDLVALFNATDDATFAALASRHGADYLLATVEMAPMRMLRARYDGWPRLEELHAEDSVAVLYRIHREPRAQRSDPRGSHGQ